MVVYEKQDGQITAQEPVALSVGSSRKGVPGRPQGLPKTGGRTKGTPSKTPLVAQAIANRHSPDAVDYLIAVMQGRRFSRNGHWVYPSIYTRTQAACKILDIAEMPAKRSLLGGTPVLVNITIGDTARQPVSIEGGSA